MNKLERDPKTGKFLPGNGGGPGRHRREIERNYLKTMQAVCTLKAWRSICCRAIEDAQQGDAPARSWLSRYLLPTPEQLIRVDDRTVDHVGEMQKAIQEAHDDPDFVDYLRDRARREDANQPHIPDSERFRHVDNNGEDEDD